MANKNRLLKKTPYPVRGTYPDKNMSANINSLSGWKVGDLFREEQLDNGNILLVHKSNFEE